MSNTSWPMVQGPQPDDASNKPKAKMHGGPYSVRSAPTILEHRMKEAEWYKEGKPMSWMAGELGIPVESVKQDLLAVRTEWRERTFAAMDDKIAEEVAKIDGIEAEAWEQYRSAIGEVERTQVTIRSGFQSGETTTIHTHKQLGPIGYLNLVLSCIDRRCKLLGLDAPEKHQVAVLAKIYTGFDPDKV